MASNRAEIAQLAAAQASGLLTDRFEAGVLLGLVLHIAAMWVEMPEELAEAVGSRSAASRGSTVADAVERWSRSGAEPTAGSHPGTAPGRRHSVADRLRARRNAQGTVRYVFTGP